jgi:hypothetical protein
MRVPAFNYDIFPVNYDIFPVNYDSYWHVIERL